MTIAATAALPRIVDTSRVQSLIASSLSQALVRPVKVRSISVAVLPYPAVRLHGVEIGEDPAFGAGPFARLDAADLRLKLWSLLRGHVEFTTLVLERPTITVMQNSDGRWNFVTLGTARETASGPRGPRTGGPAVASAALVSRIIVHHGLIAHEMRREDGTALRQRLEDVEGTLSPRAGRLGFAGSARAMPTDLGVKVTEGTLGLSGARTLNDAGVRARIELDGQSIHPLTVALLGGEPAVTGAITGRLDLSGTVGRPRAAGEVELRDATVTRTSSACPEPRSRALALATVKASVRWDDGQLVLQPLTTGIGQGSVTTKLVASAPPPAHVELSDLVLKGIPLDRVLVGFLCHGYAVTGPLDLTATLTFSPSDPARTLSGTGRFSIGAGKIIGARALALVGDVVHGGSALEFDSIAGSYEIRNGVVTTRDLAYASRALRAMARGDYAIATGQMNVDVVLDHGRGMLLAKLTGPAESPAVRVAPATVRRRIEPERVERGFRELLKKFP